MSMPHYLEKFGGYRVPSGGIDLQEQLLVMFEQRGVLVIFAGASIRV